MSQYIRTFVIPDSKDVVAEKNGQYVLKDDLVAEVVILNSDVDDYTDEMTSMDFTSVRSRITVHKGFAASHPLPKFAMLLLSLLGIRIDPRYIILLAALRIAPPVVVRSVLACCAVRCSALHAHCAISYLAAQKMSMRGGRIFMRSFCGQ
jgi:hypothetical protein